MFNQIALFISSALSTPWKGTPSGAGIVALDGSASDALTPGIVSAAFNPAPVLTGNVTQNPTTGQFSFADATGQVVLDTAGFGSLSLQIPSAVTTVVVSWSEYPTGPWAAGPLCRSTNIGAAELLATTTTSAGLYIANSQARYAQITQTAAVALTVDVDLNQEPRPNRAVYLAGAAQIDVASRAVPVLETATPLGVAGTFTGTLISLTSTTTRTYGFVQFEAYADQAGTMFVEKTMDAGTTWRPANSLAGQAVAAGATVQFRTPALATGYRVRYTNGGVAQTIFLLTSSQTQS